MLGNLELGGAERQALILAKHLQEHEEAAVEVWGFNQSGPVAELCEQHGISSRVVPYSLGQGRLKRWSSTFNFAGLLRRARPDILLPYTSLPNVVCGLVWRATGARLCVWNQRDEGLIPLNARRERRAVKRTPQFIANSHAGARLLIDKLNVDVAKVHVVHNGTKLSPAQLDRPAWRERLRIDEASFVACMVANLHANKDHATLLNAWRQVVTALEQHGRSAVLVLAGKHYGAYESLLDLVRALGIESNVRFAGQVSDVTGLLDAVDIGVFSSRSEGCPNGVLECMAAGLAVVGTDTEGIREVVGETGTTLLARPGDAESFASRIMMLAHDMDLRTAIGTANQRRVEEQYSAQRMCEQTVSVLVEAYDQGRKYPTT